MSITRNYRHCEEMCSFTLPVDTIKYTPCITTASQCKNLFYKIQDYRQSVSTEVSQPPLRFAKPPNGIFCVSPGTTSCNNQRHPFCLSPCSSTEQVLPLLDSGLSPIATKPSVLNTKSTGGLQKVQELPEVITKFGAAVRSAQERTHTHRPISKGAHDPRPKR